MSRRRGFGDETWRLAREGDAEALRRAAELLGRDADLHYEAQRARAFALAVEGAAGHALEELNEGWTEEWPFPAAYSADVARVRFLAGDYEQAVDALRLAARSSERSDEAVVELAAACVGKEPRLWLRALRVPLAAGSVRTRARGAAAILRARL